MGTTLASTRGTDADPRTDFRSEAYLRINGRRLEHLATLGLPIRGRRVLELGAGVGDLTTFFLDRGCRVTTLEGRGENVAHLRRRFEGADAVEVIHADLNTPPPLEPRYDVVFAAGVLYHLADPGAALAWMAGRCDDLLILSTCVSLRGGAAIEAAAEDPAYASQALDGRGCRPGRRWVFDALRRHLPHVYATVTQPNHEEFPLDWRDVRPPASGLSRAVFVASRRPLATPTLVGSLPATHEPGP